VDAPSAGTLLRADTGSGVLSGPDVLSDPPPAGALDRADVRRATTVRCLRAGVPLRHLTLQEDEMTTEHPSRTSRRSRPAVPVPAQPDPPGAGRPGRRSDGLDDGRLARPPVQSPARASAERALLRIGAVSAVLGIVLEVAMQLLHPSRADPNDSAAAFAEYARSGDWAYVHIGQFLGTLLIVVTLVALSRPLARQAGVAGALAVVGTLTAVLVAAVFAVQMAVDGVALKSAVDAWASASSAADRATAFAVADGIRDVEKALSSFFHLTNGLTLLTLGLSVALGDRYRRWLGWFGALAGVGFLAGSVLVARTGFSAEADRVLLPALLLSAVFVLGAAWSMWRTPRET
jgi:hypothetical protein